MDNLEDLAPVRADKHDVEGAALRGPNPRVDGDLTELAGIPETEMPYK